MKSLPKNSHFRIAPSIVLLVVLCLLVSSPASGAVARAAVPTRCQASWTNAAGGSWSTGSNWSTGAAPSASQNACITIGLSAPVVVAGQGAARSLTLGGQGKRDQLTLQGATLTLAANSSIADTGTILESGGSHIDVAEHATLTNHGSIITSPAGFLEVAGNLNNTADGFLDVAASNTYGGQSSLRLDGPGIFTNYGQLAVQLNGSITAPWQGAGVVLNNAGGDIQNSGTITINAGASLVEGAGAITGNAAVIRGGVLGLQGPGASTFQLLDGPTVSGTVAARQLLLLSSAGSPPVVAAGSLINRGTITTSASTVFSLPRGRTLFNYGRIVTRPGHQLEISGNVLNEAGGRIAVAGSAAYGGGSQLSLDAPFRLTNDGIISVQGNSTLYDPWHGTSGGVIDNHSGTIANAGTVDVDPGATFVEGAGTTSGNPIDLPGGNLDLTGSGASSFLITNTTAEPSGNISNSQTVEVAGPLSHGQVTATSSFTNYGRFIGHYGNLNLPPGDTFTNDGTVGMQPGTNLFVNGNLTNTASGLVFDSGTDAYGSGTGLTMAAGTAFDNAGTLDMLFPGGMDLRDGAVTFRNSGIINAGLGTNSGTVGSGASVLANATPNDTVDLGGAINPVLAGGYVPVFPKVPSPVPPIDYLLVTANATNPNDLNLLCGAGISGGFGIACSNKPLGAVFIIDSPTNSVDPTSTTVASSAPMAPFGGRTAPTSSYGQSVTLTATISPSAGTSPTGTVTFFDGTAILGTVQAATIGSTTSASITAASLPVGTHPIMAFYSGDSKHMASSSVQMPEVVEGDTTTIAVRATPNPTPRGR